MDDDNERRDKPQDDRDEPGPAALALPCKAFARS